MRINLLTLASIVAAGAIGIALNRWSDVPIPLMLVGAVLQIGSGIALIAFLQIAFRKRAATDQPGEKRRLLIVGVSGCTAAILLVAVMVGPSLAAHMNKPSRPIDPRMLEAMAKDAPKYAKSNAFTKELKRLGDQLKSTTRPAERIQYFVQIADFAERERKSSEIDPVLAESLADLAKATREGIEVEQHRMEIESAEADIAQLNRIHKRRTLAGTQPSTQPK